MHKIDASAMELTRKEIKRGLLLPSEISNDLAYLSGFIAGDGHLCFRKVKHEYHIECCGNLLNEREFYDNKIKQLFKKLFNADMKTKIRTDRNTYELIYYSKSILTFLSEIVGIPIGCKSHKVCIPPIFSKSEELTKHFVKGFADADFCITLKRRYKNYKYYPVINGASKSKIMIKQISDFLIKNGFKLSIDFDKITYDKRFGYTKESVINIYGHYELAKWMNIIGFENLKTISVFERWKTINKDNVRARKAFELLSSEERNFMNRESDIFL